MDSEGRQYSHWVAQNSAGFTLIEMLVVLVAVAILAGIGYPSYLNLITNARRSEGQAALLQAMQQQERHYTLVNSYAAFSRATPRGFKWHSGETPARSAYELSAAACASETLRTCVIVSAEPATSAVNTGATDPGCGILSLDSRGMRRASGNDPHCWR